MSRLQPISALDQSKVKAKLTELQEKTGKAWEFEITKKPQGDDAHALLEVIVDGHIVKPVRAKVAGTDAAEQICSELERVYAEKFNHQLS